MATRIAVLMDGRLQQLADPRTLYNEPANVFVARFIGSPPMNIVAGQVRTDETRGPAVEVGGHVLAVGDNWVDLAEGRPVDVGVRPEDLRLSDNGIAATVIAREWLGHEQIVEVEAQGTRLFLRDDNDAFDSSPGSRVRLAVDPSDVHLFDADSGDRVAHVDR